VKVPPFSGERTVEFATPIGIQKVYYVLHPEPLTIPQTILIKRMSIRGNWPAETMRLLRFMNSFGLYRREPMEIHGQTVVPYEWLSEYLLKAPEAKETAYGLIVEVSGLGKKKRVKHTFRTSHPPMEKWGGKDAYARNVGYPLLIGAQLLAKGQAKARPFFQLLRKAHSIPRGSFENRQKEKSRSLIELSGSVELTSSSRDLIPLVESLGRGDALIVAPRAPFPFQFGGGFAWYEMGEEWPPHPGTFGKSLDLLKSFLVQVKTGYPVDPARLVLLGFSQGTVMCYAAGLLEPSSVQGIVALSGYIKEVETMGT